MKKIFLSAALAIISVAAAHAQDAGRPGRRDVDPQERMNRQTEMMTKQLNLNADQTARLKALNEQRWKANQGAMEARRKKADGNREAMRAQMEKEQADYTAKLKGILTPEQMGRYEAMMKERREHMRGGMRGMPAERPVNN